MVDEKLSPINESSSASPLIGFEQSQYDDFELDDLFAELKKANKSIINTTEPKNRDDELSTIRKTISNLPKLKDSSNSLISEKEKSKLHKSNITHINDPIKITKNTKNEKENAGSKWFDMPKGELTESVKRDLKIIQQRAALDPKRHYKKGKWQIPEYFQMGTIVEGKHEFYSSRLNKKDRHGTILESVLKDNDTKQYFKRKYDEIQVKKTSGKKAHYKKVKDARRKF